MNVFHSTPFVVSTPEKELDSEEQGRAGAQAEPLPNPAADDELEADSTIDSELLRRHGETIVSALDAQQRWSDGQHIFAFHEQDGEPHLVRTFDELNSYAPDQLLGLPAMHLKNA